MARSPKDYKAVIQKIIDYVTGHLHEPILLTDIARDTGYSIPRISAIFKKETGKTLEEYTLGRRVEEAKRLLTRTRLNITEIAFEVGFNSYTRFVIAFKKRVGLSPTQFRTATAQPDHARGDSQTQSRERFRDEFPGTDLGPCWTRDSGIWRIVNQTLSGKSTASLELTYSDPLPENFSLRFEFRFLDRPHFSFALHGKEKFNFHFRASLGRHRDNTAEFTHPYLQRLLSQTTQLAARTWYSWRSEMFDDTLKIFLDEKQIYSYKDPFPSRYNNRCHFSVGGWNTVLEIREVVIHDLGHIPTVPVVRQADLLYNNNMFDSAADAYLRLLDSRTGPEGAAELQYKIGMCYLRQEKLAPARNHLRKVESLPQNEPWLSLASEALLEADRIAGDLPVFLRQCRILYENPEFRDAVRTCIARASGYFFTCGYFERAVFSSNALVEMEIPRTVSYDNALSQVPDLLFQLRRYGEAAPILQHMAAMAGDPAAVSQNFVTLADVLAYSGQFAEAKKVIAKVRGMPVPHYILVRSDMIYGSILRGTGKIQEAASFLEETPARYRESGAINFFALRMACHLYCQLGELEKAERVARQASGFASGSASVVNDELTIRFPILFAGGRFSQAAQLLADTVEKVGTLWGRADQLVCAGILYELGGDRKRATEAWINVTKRYPEPWCNYFSRLAAELLSQAQEAPRADVNQEQGRSSPRFRGKAANASAIELLLKEMPFSAFHRAKMSFHIGKLCEKRGAMDIAKNCFASAVADDPTLNWFTWVARKELRSL